ncbi:MAG: ribosome assembly cofactor RimP [Sphaerochaetaceae bacterium]|nr:ribosome assembly cofactor RimP [Sphaerochaetaceae bacterium]
MLNNEILSSPLYQELCPLVEALGMDLCDVRKSVQGKTVQIFVTVALKEGETGVDECAKVHHTILPRLQMQYGREELYMEVSTPGIQRNFRDVHEFRIFKGKRVRVYSQKFSSWVCGLIGETKDSSVCLTQYEVEDTKESGDILELNFEDIQKAKLEYKWEDMKNVRV